MIKAKYILVGSCITNYIKNVFKNTIKIKFRNTRKKKKKVSKSGQGMFSLFNKSFST